MLNPPKSQGIAMQGKHFRFHDRKKFLEMEGTTISGLSFGFRSSREVDLRVYLIGTSYAAAEMAERRIK
jgi:hypothetical protein